MSLHLHKNRPRSNKFIGGTLNFVKLAKPAATKTYAANVSNQRFELGDTCL